MAEGLTDLPEGPRSVSIVSDPRCNLACASCRDKAILEVDAATETKIQQDLATIRSYASSLQVIKLAGDGEPFYSPAIRQFFQELDSTRFPQLDHVSLLTNGLLVHAQNFEELRPGSDFIRRVSVSVDGGTEAVYREVRGGSWKTLLSNLEWLASLRATKRLDYLQISCVVREANFRSIPELVALGRRLAVDQVVLSTFLPWPRMRVGDYAGQAVHRKEHPNHPELQKILAPFAGDPRVFVKLED